VCVCVCVYATALPHVLRTYGPKSLSRTSPHTVGSLSILGKVATEIVLYRNQDNQLVWASLSVLGRVATEIVLYLNNDINSRALGVFVVACRVCVVNVASAMKHVLCCVVLCVGLCAVAMHVYTAIKPRTEQIEVFFD